jgi:hypothetical protein
MMANKDLRWLRLDNSAKLYPVLVTRYTMSLFRVSAYLNERVRPSLLQQALKDILPRFPSFNVRLRRGFFWYFLEENTAEPRVFPDDGIVLKKINPFTNRHFLFTVLYYNSRVSIEFFHAITDGLGGTEFLKALIYRYLTLLGHEMDSEGKIITIDTNFTEGEIQDSFVANYQKTTLKAFRGKTSRAIGGDDAYRIRGSYYELPGYGIIEGVVNTDKLLQLARSKGMTVTAYIGAAFLYSIYKTEKFKKKPRSLTLFLPVNLRGIYNSTTLRNFVLFSRAGIRDYPEGHNYTFDDFARAIDSDIRKDTERDVLQNQLNGMVYLEKMWIMRFLPLPLKYFFFKIGKMMLWHNSHTAILSNMGKISLPKDMSEHVKGMALNVNLAKNVPISIATASCAGNTFIEFTTMIHERDIIRDFFRCLSEDGLEVEVRSNLREDPRYVL